MEQNPAAPSFTSTCHNCGAALGGTFCSQCGQEHRHERLRLGDWLRDLLDAAANLDSRSWRTIAALTVRPGRMVREYVDGRRAPFVTPLRYSLATCALWWFAVMLNDEASSSTVWWLQYGQWINLASVPVVAITYQLPFLGSRYNYAVFLTFSLYTTGHVFLWRAGMGVAGVLGAPGIPLAIADNVLYLAYTSWALWQFSAGKVGWRALRILGALVGSIAFGTALNLALRNLTPAA